MLQQKCLETLLTGASDPSLNLQWPKSLIAEPRKGTLSNLGNNTIDFLLLTMLEIRKSNADKQQNQNTLILEVTQERFLIGWD